MADRPPRENMSRCHAGGQAYACVVRQESIGTHCRLDRDCVGPGILNAWNSARDPIRAEGANIAFPAADPDKSNIIPCSAKVAAEYLDNLVFAKLRRHNTEHNGRREQLERPLLWICGILACLTADCDQN